MRNKWLLVLTYILFTPVAHAQTDTFATAQVLEITREEQSNVAGLERTVQYVELEILNGIEKGKRIEMENGVLPGRDYLRLDEGEKIVIESIVTSQGQQYLIREKYRLPSLVWIGIFFLLMTLALAGITGFSALVGLLVSIMILATFVVPNIIQGEDPLVTSLVGAYVIACTSIYLAHGFHRRTSIAVLSTIITLTLSALLAIVFVHIAKLFGMGSEESLFLQTGIIDPVNLRGLLLGGIIIGALGVLDDITTSQTAAIHEIKKANPEQSNRELFLAGQSVGREHMASLINTLALAYVGSSLPLLLLFTINEEIPLWVTLNSEFLAEEIIRTLVGSMTLLLAVPITTLCAVKLVRADDTGGRTHVCHH